MATHDELEVARTARARILADVALGRVMPLENYQRLFPAHAPLIAILYEEIERDPERAAGGDDTLGHSTVPEAADDPADDRDATRELKVVKEPAASERRRATANRYDTRRRYGSYTIIEALGSGGQADVFIARDEKVRRLVALKVLHHDLNQDQNLRKRFRREAELGARLDHPGICRIVDFGEEDGYPYLVMEVVKGENLRVRIKRASQEGRKAIDLARPTARAKGEMGSRSGSPDQIADILVFFEKCAYAIHYAHEAGLIHRDLKPENLMATPEGEPVILDFGLVRDQADASGRLTRTGESLGTPAYMSPERIRCEKLDQTSDIFSLGVTLYECLTTRRPFEAPTLPQLCDRILKTRHTDPREYNPTLAPAVVDLFDAALAKEPSQRFRTAREFAEELHRVRRRAGTEESGVTLSQHLRQWRRRYGHLAPKLVAAAAIVFCASWIATWISLVEVRSDRDALRARLAWFEPQTPEQLDEHRAKRVAQLAHDLRQAEDLTAEAVTHETDAAWLARATTLVARLPAVERELELVSRGPHSPDGATSTSDPRTSPDDEPHAALLRDLVVRLRALEAKLAAGGIRER